MSNNVSVIADDGYIRESILSPLAKIVKGYQPIMPTFQGQVSEEQIQDLIAYIKSIGPTQAAATSGAAGAPKTGPGTGLPTPPIMSQGGPASVPAQSPAGQTNQ